MADRCAFCGSANVQDQVYGYQCLVCGRLTSASGRQVSYEVQNQGVDLNPPYVQLKGHEEGSPATAPRTPDGVADPGTIIDGMSEAAKWGKPQTDKPGDERPTSMQTEHSTVNPTLERVEDTNERGADMQKEHGFLV